MSETADQREALTMRGWEDWQKEYRFGVILIYPPEPILSRVNALRAEHDSRSHSYCDAHISLTVPAPSAIADDQWERLQSVAATYRAIRLTVGPIRVYPQHPGVTLAVEPQAELARLCGSLESVPPFTDAPPRRWPFSAHMTVAEYLTWEQSERLAARLSSSVVPAEFECSAVSWAVPDENFRFTERRRLPLGGAGAS